MNPNFIPLSYRIEFQKCLNNALSHKLCFLGCPAQGLDLMILVSTFQPSMILWFILHAVEDKGFYQEFFDRNVNSCLIRATPLLKCKTKIKLTWEIVYFVFTVRVIWKRHEVFIFAAQFSNNSSHLCSLSMKRDQAAKGQWYFCLKEHFQDYNCSWSSALDSLKVNFWKCRKKERANCPRHPSKQKAMPRKNLCDWQKACKC